MNTETAQLRFALDLHRAIAPTPAANLCWSPFSVATALSLVTLGARGPSRDELAAALCGDAAAEVSELAERLDRAAALKPARGGEDEPAIAVSNTLWTDASVPILDTFRQELTGRPNAAGAVRDAPFQQSPEQARKLINADVATTTRDLVPELIKPGVIDEDTVSALVNALYLKCAWRYRFAEDATRPDRFHTPNGPVSVPMMELTESVGYAAASGWQVVDLPAIGGVRATVLLPDADLTAVEPDLTPPTLAELLAAPTSTRVRLRLPKLDVSGRADLSEPLGELGVRTVFTREADLGGISPAPLAVQRVLHEAVLRVDERGFEGAAATAAMMELTSVIIAEPVEVTVDRPFLLLVRQADTGVIYFMTRICDPS